MALWTPAEITTSLWLDASDASTITISTGVSEWRDKSGNNRHSVQASGSSQPAIIATAQNGLDVLDFDGVNDYLTSPNVFTAASDVSVFIVCSTDVLPALARAMMALANGLDYTNGFFHAAIRPVTNNLLSFFSVDSQNAGATGLNPSTPVTAGPYFVSVHQRTAALAGLGTNGAYAEGAASGQCAFANAKAVIGGYHSFEGMFDGKICEIAILPYYAATALRQKVEGYLHWKWGLQSLLATDHPYKLLAPTTDTVGVVNFVEKLHVLTGVGTSIIPATGTCEFSPSIDEVSGSGTSSAPSFGEVVFSTPVDAVSGLGYSDAFASSAHFEPEVDGFSSYGFAGIVGKGVFRQPLPEFSSVGAASGHSPNGVANFRAKVDAFSSDGYVGINGASNFSLGPGKFSANGNVNAVIYGNVYFRGLKHNLSSQGSATILASASFKDTIARFSSSGVHGIIGSASFRTPVDIVRSRGAEIADHGILSYSRSDYIYPLPPGLTSPPSINPMQFVRN